MEPFSWECPHCFRATTITKNDLEESDLYKPLKADDNYIVGVNVKTIIIQCPNPECFKPSIYIKEYSTKAHLGCSWSVNNDKLLKEMQFFPEKNIKNFPNYIPLPILNDYKEANLISDISPKASATLSRRCLQGILRDYWKVNPKNLYEEINEIKDKIDSATWEAIDSTRKIGNIGAHMENDINLLIDVEPNEAELLLRLLEMLIESWYIESHEKEEKLRKIKSIADDKKTKLK